MTKAEAERWCRAHGIQLDTHKRPDLLSAGRSRKFTIPADAGQRVALVAGHLNAFRNTSKVLVWMHEWGVWASGERMHISFSELV
jgi:hypothetical protein